MEYIDQFQRFTNGISGLMAEVWPAGSKGFGVRYGDTDAGEWLPSVHFFPERAAALESAQKFITA